MTSKCLQLCFVLLSLLAVVYTSPASKSSKISAEESIHNVLADLRTHDVMLYSKSYCPYSIKLRRLLSKFEIKDLKIVDLDLQDNTREVQKFLKTLSGRSTVPQLYINGKFVGGHDEIKALNDEGKLLPLLEDGDFLL